MGDTKTEFASQMAALHSSFEEGLGGRIANIRKIVDGLNKQAAKEDVRDLLENLQSLSYKLAGAAGTFGFSKISSMAKILEESSIEALRALSGEENEMPGYFKRIEELVTMLQASAATGEDSLPATMEAAT